MQHNGLSSMLNNSLCVDFLIEVAAFGELHQMKLTLIRDENGYWSLSEGDMDVSEKKYLLKGYNHQSLGFTSADIVSVYEWDSISESDGAWGTSWSHRISGGNQLHEVLPELLKSK